MKSILLPLTSSVDAAKLTPVAAALAHQFRSSLTGLFVRPDPRSAIPFMGEGLTAEMIQTLCDNAEREGCKHADKAETDFRAACETAGIKWHGPGVDTPHAHWTVMTGLITDHVGRRARTADLAVCLQPSDKNLDSEDIFNDLIFRSGRNVLMVPSGFKGTVGQHIMIAWNGRTEGARAVMGALPMLRDAQKVTVVQVGDIGEDRPDMADIARYLGEHGIEAMTLAITPGEKSVGEDLLKTARDIDADMLVLGAYSHSRWREMVLGGVTKHITTQSAIPVFMSH